MGFLFKRVQFGCNGAQIGDISLSNKSAVSSCLLGIKWPYTSIVILGLEWPNLRDAISTGMPWLSIRDAAVCLRSWKRILGNPVAAKCLRKALLMLLLVRGVPTTEGNIRSCSPHLSPASFLICSISAWWSFRIFTVFSPRMIVRFPLLDLGLVNV